MCFSTPMLPLNQHTLTTKKALSVTTFSAPLNMEQNSPDTKPPHSRNNRHANRRAKSHSPVKAAAYAIKVDFNMIGKDQARKLMSEEHKLLGFRPPPGSLAADAQAAAAKHPVVDHTQVLPIAKLKQAAKADAERILCKMNQQQASDTYDTVQHQPNDLEKENKNSDIDGDIGPNPAEETKSIHEEVESHCPRRQSTTSNHKSRRRSSANRKYTNGRSTKSRSFSNASKPDSDGEKPQGRGEHAVQPPISRTETTDSVEIVCEILG